MSDPPTPSFDATDPPDRRPIGADVEAALRRLAGAMPRPGDPAGIIATETAEGGRVIWTRGDRAQLVALCRAIIDHADLAADFAAWTEGQPTGADTAEG